MAEALIAYLRSSLPDELATALEPHVSSLESADFQAIFQDPLCAHLLGHDQGKTPYDTSKSWNDFIFDRLEDLLAERDDASDSGTTSSPAYKQHFVFIVAVAALGAFLQSNVTGPPLPFSARKLLLPKDVGADAKATARVQKQLLESLKLDGEAPYRLTPNIELLSLADTILTYPPVVKNVPAAKWARLRVNFLHQRILSEISPTLQKDIYEGIAAVKALLIENGSKDGLVSFLLETASIHTHHGNDKLAKEALREATEKRDFEFAITGLLGKRTKFQQKDTSQLVVLAKSADGVSNGTEAAASSGANGHTVDVEKKQSLPHQVDLNDDTLLESISFAKKSPAEQTSTSSENPVVQDEAILPASLSALDPEKQPQLNPLDSIILLSTAASITNTNPSDGLTREETAPYATRVLDGGSSNWQVYTQALLLRSRIEGYKSRTVERGLLQLQALVDQVIADTASSDDDSAETNKPTTFLPKAIESESAPASQRLLYVHALSSPTKWELEAELAARWVNLGGLRSALEIYERLEMWAEAALCWAATEKDDKARRITRKQLFHATSGMDEDADDETEEWTGPPRDPPPSDAPRLYCILGDLDKDPAMYEMAWTVSNERYSRAQRSLGRHFYALRDHAKASLAYSKSLKVKALDHGTWFALGCVLLELEQFKRAVEAFSRAVQLDHDDAESWSNMAAALLHMPPGESPVGSETAQQATTLDDEDAAPRAPDPQKNRRDALKALKQAARLKHDNHRIWDNLLTVAASLTPPSWADIITAQTRLVELRGPIDGEKCVDVHILALLLNHIISTEEPESATRPGMTKMVVQLVERKVVPLITGEPELWRLVGRLALWRGRPGSALEAQEKAWRCVTGQPGWEHDSEERWEKVVDATVELVGAYESLGMQVKTEGLGADGEAVVAKDWKFKARSAIRGIKGKGKDSWEGTKGWERLDEALEDLKGS